MKKTLYSLMLSDDVIREIDLLAHRMGTSRSNLVNQILAERVSLRTPEQQIGDIFRAIEEMVSPSRELVPFFEPNAAAMSLKSCLDYKYRPTVRYEVALADGFVRAHPIGELSVIFRTQSGALIEAMTGFFRLWKQIEEGFALPLYGNCPPEYALYDGKLVRTIVYPVTAGGAREPDARELAAAISSYIQLFDSLMKAYIGGSLSPEGVASAYRDGLAERNVLI